jgi:PAS domain-containing protein
MTNKNKTLTNLLGLRKQAEAKLSTKKKTYPDTALSSDEMQRIIHELAVYQIELEMQQDELLQTRTELEDSLECYTELYDFAPLGYVSLTREGTIFQANLRASKQLGVDRSHLIGDRLGRFIAAEDLPLFNAWLERVFSIEGHTSCEVMLQGDGGSSSTNSFISDHPDVLLGHALRIDAVASNDGQECRAVLSDISMQKQVERENKALRSRLIEARKLTSNGRTDVMAPSDFNHQMLDKVIHSRIRLAALSYLYVVEQACFVEIKKQVRTTDGNLSVHLRMLETADYISCDKDLQSRKPQTIYRITPTGHEAFIKYKESLFAFLGA